MGRGSILLENSQVLKGEKVTPNERWAGLPASSCGRLSSVALEGATGAVHEVAEEVVDIQPAEDQQPTAQPLKTGLDALNESFVVTLGTGLAASAVFMVEHLANGFLAFRAIDMDRLRLKGCLRIHQARGQFVVDTNGGEGPWTRFVLADDGAKFCDGITIQGKKSGAYLKVDSRGQLSAATTTEQIHVQELRLNLDALRILRLERQLARQRKEYEQAVYAASTAHWSIQQSWQAGIRDQYEGGKGKAYKGKQSPSGLGGASLFAPRVFSIL